MTGARTLATLRARIERIETHGVIAPNRMALGHGEADAALQGGLARGAVHEVFAEGGRHGAAATGLSGFAGAGGGAAAAGLSAPGGGLASSSAMMRRIDARISSMEGSWTFAGCVISDSKSSTPSHALFYTKHDGICRFRLYGLACFWTQASLVPRSSAARIVARLRPCSGHRSIVIGCRMSATNRFVASVKAMSWQ